MEYAIRHANGEVLVIEVKETISEFLDKAKKDGFGVVLENDGAIKYIIGYEYLSNSYIYPTKEFKMDVW